MAIEAVVNDDTVRRQSRRATESQRDPRHPEENETGINGYSQYIIYADSFLRKSVTPSVACGATFPYHRGRLRFIVAVYIYVFGVRYSIYSRVALLKGRFTLFLCVAPLQNAVLPLRSP